MKRHIKHQIAVMLVIVLTITIFSIAGCDSSEDSSGNSATYDRWVGTSCLQQILQCVGDIWKMQVTNCTIDNVNCTITTTYENGATAVQAEDGTITFYGTGGGLCFTYNYTAGTGTPLYTIQINALDQTYTIIGTQINETTVSEFIYCPSAPTSPITRSININEVETPNLCSPTGFTAGELGTCSFQ